jgi:membrane protein DedA with SNARE-associated domain
MNTSDRHLRFGWWSLFAFLTLGVVLEALHGFKLGWYLNVDVEMRRLMFTLAHAHGTLFALVNIAAGLTMRAVKGFELARAPSLALIWGSLLLPVGFFLGGLVIHDGDPGLGVLLVPVGALLLLYAVYSAARTLGKIKSA